jgi:hypothetical protein
MNRLHVLRLTEVVRHGIRPNDEGILELPPRLDAEMKQLAIDYVLLTLPEDLHPAVHGAKAEWLRPA